MVSSGENVWYIHAAKTIHLKDIDPGPDFYFILASAIGVRLAQGTLRFKE
jgi:hypothetical protein